MPEDPNIVLQRVREQLGEAMHTAFRKASDCPQAHRIWDDIGAMPSHEWASVIDFILSGLGVPSVSAPRRGGFACEHCGGSGLEPNT